MIKDIYVSIILITYEDGAQMVIYSKDPDLTKMGINKAIKDRKAGPNWGHELYAVKHDIKSFDITVLEDNVPLKKAQSRINHYKLEYATVQQSPEEKKYETIYAAKNRIMDAFKYKKINLNQYDKQFIDLLIDNFKDDPKVLKSIANIAWHNTIKSFGHYKSLFDLTDLEDNRTSNFFT